MEKRTSAPQLGLRERPAPSLEELEEREKALGIAFDAKSTKPIRIATFEV
jgi:hypothetical protein